MKVDLSFKHEDENLRSKLQALKMFQHLKHCIDEQRTLITKQFPRARKTDIKREDFLVNLREAQFKIQDPIFRDFVTRLTKAIGHACFEYLSACISEQNFKGLRASINGNAVALDNKSEIGRRGAYESVIKHYC